MRSEDRKPSKRVFPLLQNLDLDSVTFAQVQGVGDPITIEDMNEQEMIDLIIVNLARLVCAGEWNGLLTAGGGAETLGELTDVSLDITNFVDSLLIQTNSDGAAPTTGTLSSASNNIGIGGDVMKAITSGADNVMIGHQAGLKATSTATSVFIGSYAGSSAALGGVGDQSVLIGYEAGKEDAAGAYNTLVGYQAGKARTTGNSNTMVGHFAGGRMTEGVANTFFGISAGKGASSSATGGYNCAFGDSALRGVSTGIKNIAVGRDAGTTITTGDNNVVIGGGNVASGTDDSQLLIASGNGGVSFIVGDSAGSCYQGDNATTWSTTSDRKLKREIADATKGLDAIKAIQVRNFRYRKDNPYNMDPELARVGVIAQELEEIFPEAVKENGHGHKTVSTDSINWALLKAVQELSAKVEALESAQ